MGCMRAGFSSAVLTVAMHSVITVLVPVLAVEEGMGGLGSPAFKNSFYRLEATPVARRGEENTKFVLSASSFVLAPYLCGFKKVCRSLSSSVQRYWLCVTVSIDSIYVWHIVGTQ